MVERIIGIDHAYGNIKTANTVMPMGISVYVTKSIFAGNIFEYKGMYYRIGEGYKSFIPDKSMGSDFYLFTLVAIARELLQQSILEADIYITAGLPLTQIKARCKKLHKYLLQNSEVTPFSNYNLVRVMGLEIKNNTAQTMAWVVLFIM